MASQVIPAEALPKIVRVVRMLSSPNDGEALNACRLLNRVLKGQGLDIHALAETIEQGAGRIVYRDRVVYRDRPSPEEPKGPAYSEYKTLTTEQRRAIIVLFKAARLEKGKLSDWEFDFSGSILDRLQTGTSTVTEKQFEAIRKLYKKLMGEA